MKNSCQIKNLCWQRQLAMHPAQSNRSTHENPVIVRRNTLG
jgi:hypothetical protein